MTKHNEHNKHKKKCKPLVGMDKIMSLFKRGDAVVIAVNQNAIQGTITGLAFDTRVIVLEDVTGNYFVPFDNIDYVQEVCPKTTDKVNAFKHRNLCNDPGDATGVAVDSSGAFV